jgi:hypothetical protein
MTRKSETQKLPWALCAAVVAVVSAAAGAAGSDAALATAAGEWWSARTSGGGTEGGGGILSYVPPPSNADCPQTLADPAAAPATTHFIYPRRAVTPFYQWENNDGYCGEVSMLQAGMNHGQWMSQANARLVCGATGNGLDAPMGASLLQSGPDGFCAARDDTPDYNAQFLIESTAAASAATCLSNARLEYRMYDYGSDDVGLPGYRHYVSWVKSEMIAGNQVTIGVLMRDGHDPQYDHIVSVIAIGTNHAPADSTYYDDDVIYFDDHGVFTSSGANPAIPHGVGGSQGCTPYVFGYTFGALAQTREQANIGRNFYAILIPGKPKTESYVGGNGVGLGPSVTGHDYGFSVTGPSDSDGLTLPISLRIAGTVTAGVANPPDPLAGYNYENPYIGATDDGDGCTNATPPAMSMTLEVTVHGLTAGLRYNLYEYDFSSVSGTASAAALAVPTSRFNARAAMASVVTPIVAGGPTFVTTVEKLSSQTIVFRAVPATAP